MGYFSNLPAPRRLKLWRHATGRQENKPYDTHAQKLVKKSLKIFSRLFIFVGKPFCHTFLYLLAAAIFFLRVAIHLILFVLNTFPTNHLNQKLKKSSKRKGIIFKSSHHKLKKSFAEPFKKIQKQITRLSKQSGAFLWNMHVGFLALEKLLGKIISLTNLKTAILFIHQQTRLFILKNKLRLIHFFYSIPRPKLAKVSKLRILFASFMIFLIVLFFSAVAFWQLILKDLPSPKQLTNRNINLSTKIYDRNGVPLYNIYKDQNRSLISLADIPPQVTLATLAIEDAEFYSHPGFSIKGIARATIRNIEKGELVGGSTITQQLVKNALLTSEKTLIRKIKELTLAILVELTYEKDEILEMYLNEVSYGGTAYGIQEASRTYFGKDVDGLTLAEAALLAGLPKSPTKYSPFGSNPDLASERQKEVLELMQINKYISQEQKEKAKQEKLKFAVNKTDIKAPHFVMYVRQTLEDKYGKEVVEKGGLEVITTLDFRIQQLAERVVHDEVKKLKNLNVENGAALVLNPRTGEILAMVGSTDYFDTASDGNVNVTTRTRQPGSSIKIVNYAYALSEGFTAATILDDSPVTFLVEGQPPYTPKNYEGGFRGKLTLRSALAESRNVPAVKVLSSYGVASMLEMGKKMGITTWQNPNNYGLSLTLGGGEVKLIDLARAYATIANYGVRPELNSVLKIVNYQGKTLEELGCNNKKILPLVAAASASQSAGKLPNLFKSSCTGKKVLDPRVAFIITDILSDNDARAPSFGESSLLSIPNHPEVAAKTGTSNNLRDNLAIGFTQDYVVAVWVGNNDNSEMSRIASGVTGATPIFNKIISALLADASGPEGLWPGGKENEQSEEQIDNWPVPNGLVQLPICPYTGTLACPGCPMKMEWFLEENKPEKACSSEWFVKRNDDKSQKHQGQLLPEAAKIEVVDLRKNTLR